MAAEKRTAAITKGPMPIPGAGEMWGMGSKFEVGEYEARIEQWTGLITPEGKKCMECHLRMLSTPEGAEHLRNEEYVHRFYIHTDANLAFLRGFLYQVEPEGLDPKNFDKKGQPQAEFFTGAVIKVTFREETYTNNDGKEITTARMQNKIAGVVQKPPRTRKGETKDDARGGNSDKREADAFFDDAPSAS